MLPGLWTFPCHSTSKKHSPSFSMFQAPEPSIPLMHGLHLTMEHPLSSQPPRIPLLPWMPPASLASKKSLVPSCIMLALSTPPCWSPSELFLSAKAKGTEATAQAVTQLLNYCATHPDAIVRHHASDMQLHVHSDASYLSESQARSRTGGTFFLSSFSKDPKTRLRLLTMEPFTHPVPS